MGIPARRIRAPANLVLPPPALLCMQFASHIISKFRSTSHTTGYPSQWHMIGRNAKHPSASGAAC